MLSSRPLRSDKESFCQRCSSLLTFYEEMNDEYLYFQKKKKIVFLPIIIFHEYIRTRCTFSGQLAVVVAPFISLIGYHWINVLVFAILSFGFSWSMTNAMVMMMFVVIVVVVLTLASTECKSTLSYPRLSHLTYLHVTWVRPRWQIEADKNLLWH